MAYIELQALSKQYPDKKQWALKEFQLSIEKGEFIAIVGPSGSGKSTLLNLLTGFEKVTAGQFILDNEELTKASPKNRNIAMVFQEYALFPHMTVEENITFGMKVRKEEKQIIESKLHWASEQLELDGLLQEKPKNLSGGQRQRVALARAIVREPKLFLLDEPLSNLDAKLREQTGALIRRVHDELKATTIFVTHAQDEAMTLADRVVVLKDGQIQQIGTPRDIYESPINLFTASFIGRPEINQLSGEILADGSIIVASEKLGSIDYSGDDKQVIVAIRSEDIQLSDNKSNQKGTVREVRYMGSDQLLSIKWKEETLTLRAAAHAEIVVGQEVNFVVNQNKLLIFNNKEQQLRIE
ncbi:ABC transporter ATP-binding protein [Enterococcus sp. BWR-S5]|uniref:ABC transporter ATP-binding protein n=1 Tax=Enterococcus sp. BWR-S5 TaxID=2787714 RepID=UPI0019215807|nr:ABC transporter ATP-binding protein [Enterococcus sp. BWR-S5]MBL1225569.1 ABC transporter ATP-binding protein [Enterococcus sp. BWR-S5]